MFDSLTVSFGVIRVFQKVTATDGRSILGISIHLIPTGLHQTPIYVFDC